MRKPKNLFGQATVRTIIQRATADLSSRISSGVDKRVDTPNSKQVHPKKAVLTMFPEMVCTREPIEIPPQTESYP